ncbi:MAG TPA: thiol oxidoreductase, partial [Ferruginibacter sp.]|nr:thiol oxidoreductase [Ferruginibacter sp.]
MKKTYYILAGLITAIIIIIQACSKLQPATPADDELLDGPVAGLTYEQNRQFLAGDVAFNNEVFTTQTGLGSIFVATSC